MQQKDRRWPVWTGFTAAMVSIMIAGYTLWITQLRSFDISITVQPTVNIQQKRGQFGIYIAATFHNVAQRSGSITQLSLLLAHSNSPADRYLMTFNSFRIKSEDNVTFEASDEVLPIFLQGKAQLTRISSFMFDVTDPFPLAAGVYNAELLVWTDYSERAHFSHPFSLLISQENAREYISRKESNSTTLIPVEMVGYAPLKSRKLSRSDYSSMR